METNNSIVQFMGWCGADASNASFMINRIALPHGTVKLLVAFEGDHYGNDERALYTCHGYRSFHELQEDLGNGIRFVSNEYSPLLDRSLYLYEILPGPNHMLSFPVGGERWLEIYAMTLQGQLILLYEREFCCK